MLSWYLLFNSFLRGPAAPKWHTATLSHARERLLKARGRGEGGGALFSRGTRRADSGLRIMCAPRAGTGLERSARSWKELTAGGGDEPCIVLFYLYSLHVIWTAERGKQKRQETDRFFWFDLNLEFRERVKSHMKSCCCDSAQLLRSGADFSFKTSRFCAWS